MGILKYKVQVNVEAELEGAAEDLGRMAVWDEIQVGRSIQDVLFRTKLHIMLEACSS